VQNSDFFLIYKTNLLYSFKIFINIFLKAKIYKQKIIIFVLKFIMNKVKFTLILLLILTINTKFLSAQKYTQAPDFSLYDTKGEEVNLYDSLAEGKVILLHFFSINCGSCHTVAPIVDSIYRQFGSGTEDLIVWGIVQQDYNSEQIEAFMELHDLSFRCFPTGHATDVFGLYDILYTPQIMMVCDYMLSPSLSYYNIIETLSYCIPTIKVEEKLNEFNINIIGGVLNIESNKKIKEIQIFDYMGRLILTKKNPKNNINISALNSNSLYIINFVFDDDSRFISKIISQ
jgi:peroxiredoxin